MITLINILNEIKINQSKELIQIPKNIEEKIIIKLTDHIKDIFDEYYNEWNDSKNALFVVINHHYDLILYYIREYFGKEGEDVNINLEDDINVYNFLKEHNVDKIILNAIVSNILKHVKYIDLVKFISHIIKIKFGGFKMNDDYYHELVNGIDGYYYEFEEMINVYQYYNLPPETIEEILITYLLQK